jgi:hypothetical protein
MFVNRMDAIISARYAPLVFIVGLHRLPSIYYMKYFLRYNGEGDVIAEEHMVSFYNFIEKFNIDYANEVVFAKPVWGSKEMVSGSPSTLHYRY